VTTVLVTGAGGSASTNLIDALRLGGHVDRVIGADLDPIRLQLSAADSNYILPRADEPTWVDAINWISEREKVDVLFCQPDVEVMALGRHRAQIAPAVWLPSQSALETAADKAAFASAMVEHGVDVPESVGFTDAAGLREVVSALLTRHPDVWIRARIGAGARGSLPVSTVDQAEAWVKWWVEEKGLSVSDFMASERLPGREFAYQSVWQHGELVAGQARERVEYLYGHLTPHGQTSTPSVARTVAEPSVDELAQAAIRAIDPAPHGVYCADIKQDHLGRPKVTEINAGRFFTTSNFFAHAGLNMPDMVLRGALGEDLPRVGTSPLAPDLYWIRMVDMGFKLVAGNDLDNWPRADI
jgi:carbamoyl-phosphate synthase large subunit